MAEPTTGSQDDVVAGRSGGRTSTTAETKPKAAARSRGDGKGAVRAEPIATTRRSPAMPRAKPRTKEPDLRKDLRDFASGRPQGWDHEDWLSFLESLRSRGHDIADREAIGMALEKERLDLALGGVKGIGPQKRQALVERYGTLWALRNADAEEIARVGGVSSAVAERIRSEAR